MIKFSKISLVFVLSLIGFNMIKDADNKESGSDSIGFITMIISLLLNSLIS